MAVKDIETKSGTKNSAGKREIAASESGTNGNSNGGGSSSSSSSDERENTNSTASETNNPTETEEDGETKGSSVERETSDEAEESTPAAEKPKKRSKLLYIIGGAVLLIAAIGGLLYWLHARQYETTDDAFIDGDVIQISPKVSAYINKVYVESNQRVHKGDLMVELNPSDYEAKLEQAKAQLRAAQAQKNQTQAQVALTRKTVGASQTQAQSGVESAQNNVQQTRAAAAAKQSQIKQAQDAVKTAQANLAQTRAQAPQIESNLNLAEKEYNRRLNLYNTGDISKQLLDEATNALQTARAQLNQAEKQVQAAQSHVNEAQAGVATAQENYRQSLAQIELTKSQVGESVGQLQDANAAPERIDVSQTQVGNADASIAQAEAAVHAAELDLANTKIYAPEDGTVTRKTIEEGQLVQPGTPMMAIAQSDDVWVVANFKETQLELMRVGQPVDIEVDAYPNETFHGKIDSFQSGTGSRFSLLPSENATGNYVKVVQRVPVKIVFDKQPSEDKAHLLAPGMSVQPSVKVR